LNTRSGVALLSNVSKNSLSVAINSLSRFASIVTLLSVCGLFLTYSILCFSSKVFVLNCSNRFFIAVDLSDLRTLAPGDSSTLFCVEGDCSDFVFTSNFD
jgi:hypothetical protein